MQTCFSFFVSSWSLGIWHILTAINANKYMLSQSTLVGEVYSPFFMLRQLFSNKGQPKSLGVRHPWLRHRAPSQNLHPDTSVCFCFALCPPDIWHWSYPTIRIWEPPHVLDFCMLDRPALLRPPNPSSFLFISDTRLLSLALDVSQPEN